MAATVTGAFVVLDRASRPIRRIRDSAREADKWVDRLGNSLDRVGTSEQRQMMGRTANQLRMLGSGAHEAADDVEELDDRLDKAGAPQHARRMATNAQAIQNTGRAARTSTRPVGELTRGVKSLGNESERSRGRLAKFGSSVIGLRSALMFGLVPAIGLAVQGIGALGAGVVGLLPRLTDLVGLAAPAATAVTGLGLAMITVKLATADLSKALGGNKEALKNLTPEAKAFVTTLRQYKPLVEDLRRSAQRGLFPGLELAIRRIAKAAPMANTLLENMGRTVGKLAAVGAARMTRGGVLTDLELLGNEGTRMVDRMGRGVLNLTDAFRNFMVAGLPFTRWLTDAAYGWTENIKHMSEAGRESGRLSAWFGRVRESLESLGRISSNVWGGLTGTLKAARTQTNSLYDGIERLTGRWDEWANSSRGQKDMRQYFADMREPLREIVGFVGALGAGLGTLSQGSGFTESMRALREATPALAEGLNSMAENFGPLMVRALSETVEMVSTLVGASGPLTLALDMFTDVLTVVNNIVQAVPGLGAVMAAALSVIAIRRFAGFVSNLAREWLGVARNARVAKTAQDQALASGPGNQAVTTGGRKRRGGTAAPATTGNGTTTLLDGRMRSNPGGPAPVTTTPGVLARGRDAAGRGARALPGGVRAAGRFAAPVAGLMAVTDFASTPGNFNERFGSAVEGASFGLLNAPMTRAEGQQAGVDKATALVDGGARASALRERANQLKGRLDARTGPDNSAGNWGGFRPEWAGGNQDQSGYKLAHGTGARKKVEAELKALNAQLPVTIKVEHEQAVREAETNATALAQGYGQAFNVYNRRYGIHKGMREVQGDVIAQMKQLGPVGRRELGQSMISWAREQARQNPKLWGHVHSLESEITSTFRRMGKTVRIVNGRILTGSAEQWSKIEGALADPAERARQKVSRSFTALQREAAAALRVMGFSEGDANALIRGAEKGKVDLGSAGTVAKRQSGGPTGGGGSGNAYAEAIGGAQGDGWGRGIGDGIGPRGPQGLPTATTSSQTSSPTAVAGGGGDLKGAKAGLAPYAKDAASYGLSVSSGLRAGSITNAGNVSYHSSGDALDLAGSPAAMLAFAKHAATAYGGNLEELIHSPMGFSIKNGQRVSPYAVADHYDHVHIADKQDGSVAGGGAGGGGASTNTAAGGAAQIALRRQRETGGVADKLASRAHNQMAAALEKRINDQMGAGGATGGGAMPGGYSGGSMTMNQVAQLAESVGLPGLAFAQIAKGESGFNPKAVGHDPGGTQGLGLWQITTGFNDDIIARFGGRDAMFDPLTNARAAKAIYDRQGIKAWYGTKYLTDPGAHFTGDGWGMSRMGKIPDWGGSFAKGGSFTASKSTLIEVGEGNAPEHVQITPKSHPTSTTTGGGGSPISIVFQPGSVIIGGTGPADAEAFMEQVMERVAAAISGMTMEDEGDLHG